MSLDRLAAALADRNRLEREFIMIPARSRDGLGLLGVVQWPQLGIGGGSGEGER